MSLGNPSLLHTNALLPKNILFKSSNDNLEETQIIDLHQLSAVLQMHHLPIPVANIVPNLLNLFT